MFWKLNGKPFPWDTKKSIYKHIKAHLDGEGRLPEEFADLPDEDISDEHIRFAPGAMDGIFGHHASGDSSEGLDELLNNLVKLSARPTLRCRALVYEMLMRDATLGLIDGLLDKLVASSEINRKNLYKEALWMAREANHRGVVKFAISILGLYRTEANMNDLLTLGKHDEFTLYVAVAIQNRSINVDETLFKLAQDVSGWGKIHIVEQLEPSSPRIRKWLLEQGCENSIMPEYLACICARKGELHQALRDSAISDDLYKGAEIIISALLNGGPAENVDDYEHSPQVIRDFLGHSKIHAAVLQDYNTISQIQDFLSDNEAWPERFNNGWSPDTRRECLQICEEIAGRAVWAELVTSEIRSGDMVKQWHAKSAAARLKMDVWPVLFEMLEENPLDSALYYDLMKTSDRERIEKLIAFAENNLPLAAVASGAAKSMGFGSEYQAHRCLDPLLQDLHLYEGLGGNLVMAGLKSPVIRNRHFAIRTLQGWGAQYWPDGSKEELKKIATSDPDDDVRTEAGTCIYQ